MKSDRIKNIALRVGVVIGIIACLLTIFVNLASLRCFNAIFDSVCSVQTTRNVVALTFSDGPDEGTVNEVLPVLASRDAKATFFLSGQKVANAIPATKRLLAAGHELGNLGYSNQVMEDRPQSFHRAEIMQTDKLLRDAGVENPNLFRPPYGIRSVGLLWELHSADYKLVMWNVSDNGKREAPPEALANAIVAQSGPGSIIMLHALDSGDDNSRAALPLILDGLAEKGLKVVTVSELLEAKGK